MNGLSSPLDHLSAQDFEIVLPLDKVNSLNLFDLKAHAALSERSTQTSEANLPERNLAVEMLERLLEGQIKTRFAKNVAKVKQFSDMLRDVIKRYQNRAIETAQVIETAQAIEELRPIRTDAALIPLN